MIPRVGRALALSSLLAFLLSPVQAQCPVPVIDGSGSNFVAFSEDLSPVAFNLTLTGCTTNGQSHWQIFEPAHDGLAGVLTRGNTGIVTFLPNQNFNGSNWFIVEMEDRNGRADHTAVFVSISPVNDPPTFTLGSSNIELLTNASFSQLWVTNISVGPPDESGQTFLGLTLSNSVPALFSTQPELTSNGVLSFVAGPATGTAELAITARDDGGTSPGVDRSTQIITVRIFEPSGATTGAGTTGGDTGSTGGTSGGTASAGSTTGADTGGTTGQGTGSTTGAGSSGGSGTAGASGLALLDWEVVIKRPKPDSSRKATVIRGVAARGVVKKTGLPRRDTSVLAQIVVVTNGAIIPSNAVWIDASKVSKVNRKGNAKFRFKGIGQTLATNSLEEGSVLDFAIRVSTNFNVATTETNRATVRIR